MDEQQTSVASAAASDASGGQAPIPDALKDVEENKDIAALGYIWILSVFVFFARKNSPFVRFHAKQGMVLFAASVLLWFVPFIGRFLELIVLGLAVLGFLNAAQGSWRELPLIGALARGDKDGVRKGWKSVTDIAAKAWHDLQKSMQKPKPAAAPTQPAPSAAPAQPSSPAEPVHTVSSIVPPTPPSASPPTV